MTRELSEAHKEFKEIAQTVDRCIEYSGLDLVAVEQRLRQLVSQMPIEEQIDLGYVILRESNLPQNCYGGNTAAKHK